jgi:hypothetical protein
MGNLWIAASEGGAYGVGTLVQLVPSTMSDQPWMAQVISSFNRIDGAYPASGVIVGPDGSLYGNTPDGGGFECGAVFQYAPLSDR